MKRIEHRTLTSKRRFATTAWLLGSIGMFGCSAQSESGTPTDTGATTGTTTASVAPGPLVSPTNTGLPTTGTATSTQTAATTSNGSAPPSPTSPSETSSEGAAPGDTTLANEGSSPTTATEGTAPADGETFLVESQLASEVDPAAPTTVGIVTWSTTLPDVTQAKIEFGLTTEYGFEAPVDLGEENLRTLLLGMKPGKTYHFRVVATSAGEEFTSADYTITTGAKTTAVDIGSFEVLAPESREPGFTVASYWGGTGSSVAFIIDQDGEIVWAYDTGISGGIAKASISEDGKNMWVISASNNGTSLRRVGMDGLGAETYAATVGSHDITPVEGETMAFIDYGEEDCDSIFEIDPSGTTKEVWDSEDLQTGSGGPRCHGNALRYSAAEGVYTFSDVGTDIVQLSRDGELVWKLTEKVPSGNVAWGGVQHGHHLLQDSIVVFANTASESTTGSSAVIEYSLEDGAELWSYEGADGEKSANLGDAQRLPGGNTLITFSNDSIVHEVSPDGEVVLRWTGTDGTRLGYLEWRPSLYGGSPFLHD